MATKRPIRLRLTKANGAVFYIYKDKDWTMTTAMGVMVSLPVETGIKDAMMVKFALDDASTPEMARDSLKKLIQGFTIETV